VWQISREDSCEDCNPKTETGNDKVLLTSFIGLVCKVVCLLCKFIGLAQRRLPSLCLDPGLLSTTYWKYTHGSVTHEKGQESNIMLLGEGEINRTAYELPLYDKLLSKGVRGM
jgi:hypothetical protein